MSDAFRLEGGCSLKDLGRSKDGNQKDSKETVSGSLRALEDIYREDFKEKMIPKPRRKGPLVTQQLTVKLISEAKLKDD